jgi:hypothetical protein
VFQNIFLSGYCAVSALFVVVTFLEGWNGHGVSNLYRAVGLLGSSVWPLLLVLFFLHNLLSRKFSDPARTVLCEYRAPNRSSSPKKT